MNVSLCSYNFMNNWKRSKLTKKASKDFVKKSRLRRKELNRPKILLKVKMLSSLCWWIIPRLCCKVLIIHLWMLLTFVILNRIQFFRMDIQFIDERIAALIQARDECQCDDQQSQHLRDISNALIKTWRDLRQQILDSLVDGFFTDCDCKNPSDIWVGAKLFGTIQDLIFYRIYYSIQNEIGTWQASRKMHSFPTVWIHRLSWFAVRK